MGETRNTSKGGFRELRVYQSAYATAMDILRRSRLFPAEERYSLTSQIRGSPRSVAANIAEGYRKRQYPAMFSSKLADADAEATETGVWLDFARDCGYLAPDVHRKLVAAYDGIGRMLHVMIADPKKFAPRGFHFWASEEIMQVRRQDNGFEDFSQRLRAQRLIDARGQRKIEKDFIETNRSFMNVCPGFEVVFAWGRAKANRLDRDEQFVEAVRSRAIEALGTRGQSL